MTKPIETLRGECVHGAGAALIAVGLAAIPLLFRSNAYFLDDMQAQFMPTLYAIGETLRQTHQLPILTTQSWNGGNLLGEYQFALLNPIALALYGVLPSFKTLAAGAAFLALVHYALLGAGAFALARALGLSRAYAQAAAITIAGNNFLFYWYASSWYPGFASFPYLLWAMAFLLRAPEDWRAFVAAGVSTYLVVATGWPHTTLALALFTLIWSATLLRASSLKTAAIPSLAAGLGALMATPALAPLLARGETSSRVVEFSNHGLFLPNLGDLLAFSSPAHHGHMLVFGGYDVITNPIWFAGWFVLPLLAILDWRKLAAAKRPMDLCWLVFTGAMLFGALGPEQFGPLRWSFRFMPFFQVAMVLLALIALNRAGPIESGARAFRRLALALGVQTVLSLQSDPLFAGQSLIFAAVLAAAALAWWTFHRRETYAALALGLVSFGIAVATHIDAKFNRNLPDWSFRRQPEDVQPLNRVARASTLYSGDFGDKRDPKRFDDFVYGQMNLVLGLPMINGYSSIGHAGLAQRFCFETHGATCAEAAPRLFETDAETGLAFADLMRVDRVIARRGPHLEALNAAPHGPWSHVEERPTAVIFSRAPPNADLPGTLAWPLRGVRAEGVGEPEATRETLRILSREAGAATLIFARAFWSGYQATFNGAPVAVRPYGGFLVAVDLPANGETGELTLRFAPKFFATTLAIALGALLALIGAAEFLRRGQARGAGAPVSKQTSIKAR